MILSLKNTFYLCSRYDKVYISFYILLSVCLLAGFGSVFGSGQEHDVVRTVGLENSAVALCNISESNNGQEKKEINNESYHFIKSVSAVQLPLFLFAPCALLKFCELIPLLPS